MGFEVFQTALWEGKRAVCAGARAWLGVLDDFMRGRTYLSLSRKRKSCVSSERSISAGSAPARRDISSSSSAIIAVAGVMGLEGCEGGMFFEFEALTQVAESSPPNAENR